ncbi:hypothetical protein QC762_509920 [Podospora pseudocomata]|uniref:UBC core domain-containing protein n=1 Tax=Podospora pseudocomata TaxID=2093779 RepID=A0ABR0GDJ2_9PEZI|nr:hypothetical protein QC762_509920 [Podospora pseudocomata]
MADPLSITASIVGIVAAASKVLSLLGDITDAPRSIADLLNEVYDLRLIFCNLQSFIDRTRRFDPSRLALIQLGDLVAILTRTVITFSELESIVRPLCDREKLSTWQLVSWRWQQTAALRILTQLQRHKTSLSLMLQIYQWHVTCPLWSRALLTAVSISVTDLEARQKAGALRDHLEQELDDNQGLADRLAGMELSPELEEMSTAVFDMNDTSSALQTPGDRQDPTTADLELAKTGVINTDLPLNTPPDQASTNKSEDDDGMTDSEFQLSRAFEVVLFRTWPDSPYAGGVFIFSLRFPIDYPLRAPAVRFLTRIYHPNITMAGDINPPVTGIPWVPATTLSIIVDTLHQLLQEPRIDFPLNEEIARVYETDRQSYLATARQWTKRYAI